MKQVLIGLILLLIFACPGRGQEAVLYNMLSRLDSARIDSLQVQLRLDIASEISNEDIRKALDYAHEALHMAVSLNAPVMIAESKLAIGTYFDYLGVQEEAIIQLSEARDKFSELGMTARELQAELLIGNAYFYLQQYESALKYFQRGYINASELEDSLLILKSINSIGAAYGNLDRKDTALVLFNQANSLARKMERMDQVIATYFNMGDVNLYAGRIDDALGIFHDLEQNYDLAHTNSRYLSSLYNSMTRAFILKGDLKWARRYAEKTRIALEDYSRLTETMQYYQQCYQIEDMSGNPTEALEHYKRYTELKDSLNNASFKERLLNLEIYFDVQAKDVQIESLTLDNQLKDLQIRQRIIINYGAIGAMLLVLLIAFLVVRFNMNTRRQNRILEAQKSNLELAYKKISSQSEDLKQKNIELEAVIDELKATQQHLVQSEKMASLGTLTAGIAHEINNPLNFISGGLGLIEETEKADRKITEEEQKARRKRALEMAKDGLDRTSGIVNALMTFSHKGSSKKIKADLNEIVDNTLLFLQSKITDKVVIEKDYRLDEEVPVFPEKMHQVIMNIIDNAIHAVRGLDVGKGHIKICTCRKEQFARLEISNNGPAIPEKELGQLFDPFFTTKEPGEGTGLGLSISYTLIGDHGGRLLAGNTDEGVAFTIEIPA